MNDVSLGQCERAQRASLARGPGREPGASGLIAELSVETAAEFGVEVTLAPPESVQEQRA
jgi:hypothetical protein